MALSWAFYVLRLLIGGTGLYKSCDPKHHKTWLNNFYLMLVAATSEKGTYYISHIHPLNNT
jgi:uncharacterized membrane protein YsdA (DUF1294 family)